MASKGEPWMDPFHGRNYKQIYERNVAALKGKDRKLVLEFLEFKIAEGGVGWARIAKLSTHLRYWRTYGWLSTPYPGAEKVEEYEARKLEAQKKAFEAIAKKAVEKALKN